MIVHRLLQVFGAAVVIAGCSSLAQAQYGWGGGCGFGFGMPYNVYSMNAPPYFAMFPPVYYSHVVPRPYGYSPFAYPPGFTTPERVAVPFQGPQRYARRSSAQPSPSDTVRTAARPVIIKNPYVLAEGTQPPRRLADGRPLPQTINLRNLAVASTLEPNRPGQVAENR